MLRSRGILHHKSSKNPNKLQLLALALGLAIVEQTSLQVAHVRQATQAPHVRGFSVAFALVVASVVR